MHDRAVDNRLRSFDASLGRYLNRDPLLQWGGVNIFEYARSNPLRRIDPLGMTSIVVNVRGGTITVDPEVPGRSPYTIPITSGRDDCQNNPTCETGEDRGPIPSGDYAIDSSAIDDPGTLGDIARRIAGGRGPGGIRRPADWGDWRVPLRPTTSTESNPAGRRSGFYLHGGDTEGSAGCVDFGGGWFGDPVTDQLKSDIGNDPDGSVPVVVY